MSHKIIQKQCNLKKYVNVTISTVINSTKKRDFEAEKQFIRFFKVNFGVFQILEKVVFSC